MSSVTILHNYYKQYSALCTYAQLKELLYSGSTTMTPYKVAATEKGITTAKKPLKRRSVKTSLTIIFRRRLLLQASLNSFHRREFNMCWQTPSSTKITMDAFISPSRIGQRKLKYVPKMLTSSSLTK